MSVLEISLWRIGKLSRRHSGMRFCSRTLLGANHIAKNQTSPKILPGFDSSQRTAVGIWIRKTFSSFTNKVNILKQKPSKLWALFQICFENPKYFGSVKNLKHKKLEILLKLWFRKMFYFSKKKSYPWTSLTYFSNFLVLFTGSYFGRVEFPYTPMST